MGGLNVIGSAVQSRRLRARIVEEIYTIPGLELNGNDIQYCGQGLRVHNDYWG